MAEVILVDSLDIEWSYPVAGQVAGAVVRVEYDNTISGLTSSTVKAAIDELAAGAAGALPKSGGTMTGAIAMGANAITGLPAPSATGDAARKGYVDLFLPLAGGTITGAVDLQGQVRTTPGADLGTTGTVTLDASAAGLRSTGALTGDVTFATSNLAAGRSVTVRVVNGATERDLTFPADWTFVGAKPTSIAASKDGILTITAFGTTDASVVAAWAVEA